MRQFILFALVAAAAVGCCHNKCDDKAPKGKNGQSSGMMSKGK